MSATGTPVAMERRPIIEGVKGTMCASRIATIASAATSTSARAGEVWR
jgi:hypothetical protein